MNLTDKQSKAYLKDSSKCPVCRSDEISGDPVEIDGPQSWQRLDCGNCGASWGDVYKLTDVELTDIPLELRDALEAPKKDLPMMLENTEYPHTKTVIERRLKQ